MEALTGVSSCFSMQALERSLIHLLFLALVAGDGVEGLIRLGQRLLRASHLRGVRVNVIDDVPVTVRTLGSQTVDVDGCTHRPRMLIEREVLVDDPHLILVPLHQSGKQLRVHLGAEGTLEVVEAYDDHRSVRRATARRSSIGADQSFWVLADVELIELRQGLSIRRQQEGHRLGALAVGRKEHRDLVESRNVALGSGTNDHLVIGREIRLGSNEDLNPSSKLRRKLSSPCRGTLRVTAGRGQHQDEKEGAKQTGGIRHNASDYLTQGRIAPRPGSDQKSRSARLRFPAVPMFASVKLKRYVFSLRTEPSSYFRYSTLRPQQSQLYWTCRAPYCTWV